MTQYPNPWQQQSQPLPPPQYPPQQGYSQPLQPGYDGPPVPQQPPLYQPPVYPQPQSQMQQPYYGVPMQPIMQQNVNVNIQTKQTSFIVRILYFLCIGWWLGFFWLNFSYFLCLTVIGLPLGLVMLNRLPQVLTLRPAGTATQVQVSSSASMMQGAIVIQQNVNITIGGTQQLNFFVRALYFIFIGSWLGYIWAYTGYALCLFIVTIPLGLVMLNRLPAVLTLRKN
ncbi:MAG TPA: hypothetical protein VF026_30310 [Ktedonobacteraceae bacterium]